MLQFCGCGGGSETEERGGVVGSGPLFLAFAAPGQPGPGPGVRIGIRRAWVIGTHLSHPPTGPHNRRAGPCLLYERDELREVY